MAGTVLCRLGVLFLVCSIQRNVLAVTLSCGEDKTAEVIHNKPDNTFTCFGLTAHHEVSWRLPHTASSLGDSLGRCPPLSSSEPCSQGGAGAAFTPYRDSGSVSTMVVDATKLKDQTYLEGGKLSCADSSGRDSCQVDYVVPAEGSCTVHTGSGTDRFRVVGSCDLQPGATSSRDRYRCEWYRDRQTSPEANVTLTHSNYQTDCRLNTSLTSTEGSHTYSVTLIPGRTTVTASGAVVVEKPTKPYSTDCGGDTYIPENTNVTCTCTTDNIGTPAGRLQWVKFGQSVDVISGDYGNNKLTVSQFLQRNDHDKPQFRCNVGWMSDIVGDVITFKVGFPPTQLSIGLNNNQGNLIVDEDSSVEFQCRNSDGRPDPALSLIKRDNNTRLDSRVKFLTYSVTARCEDSGTYICEADNRMGPAFTSVSRHLSVQCAPRGNLDVGVLNFLSEPVSISFEVTANPAPGPLTFDYLGPAGNDAGGGRPTDSQIRLGGQCTVHERAEYMYTCTVTVTNVTTAKAAGVYRITVPNSKGSEHFHLQVRYQDPNTPNDKQTAGINMTFIAAGCGGAVFIILVIIIVVVIVRKRRKAQDDDKMHHLTDVQPPHRRSPDENGQAINPGHEADPEDPSGPGSPLMDPQPAAAEGGDLYSVVNKPNRQTADSSDPPAPEASAAQPEVLYAVVNKTKDKPAPASGAKPKSAAKRKKVKGKKAKKAEQNEEGHIYSNMHAENEHHTEGQEQAAPAMEQTLERQMNPDGLLYSSMDFSDMPSSAAPKPVPSDQGVLYSSVDFAKTEALQQ